MFRLRKKTPAQDILKSELFNDHTFYNAFMKDLKCARKEIIIESPYMTTSRLRMLSPLLKKSIKRGVKVRVHTRNPSHHDELLRIQSRMVVKSLKEMGVRVFFFNNYLHRKTAVIDSHIVWEGSLNILSQSNSCEFMRRIESEKLTKELIKFLDLRSLY